MVTSSTTAASTPTDSGFCQDSTPGGYTDEPCNGAQPFGAGVCSGQGPVTENCDTLDNDCSAATEDNPDSDSDGVNACDGDCDDSDPNRFPGNPEVCDAEDNDCDPLVDEDPVDGTLYYVDGDGDGVGAGTAQAYWETAADLGNGSLNQGCINVDFGEDVVFDSYCWCTSVSGLPELDPVEWVLEGVPTERLEVHHAAGAADAAV